MLSFLNCENGSGTVYLEVMSERTSTVNDLYFPIKVWLATIIAGSIIFVLYDMFSGRSGSDAFHLLTTLLLFNILLGLPGLLLYYIGFFQLNKIQGRKSRMRVANILLPSAIFLLTWSALNIMFERDVLFTGKSVFIVGDFLFCILISSLFYMQAGNKGNTSPLVNTFKDVSIRGRLAYGAICLEQALAQFHIDHPLLHELVLARIWAFTSASDLGEWDEKIREVDPFIVVDSAPLNQEPEPATLSRVTFKDLRDLYQNIPCEISCLISEVIEIGTANLYGGTGEYSTFTLEALKAVIQHCVSLKIPLPEIEPFKKSKFSEHHGWGSERPKEYYLSN